MKEVRDELNYTKRGLGIGKAESTFLPEELSVSEVQRCGKVGHSRKTN